MTECGIPLGTLSTHENPPGWHSIKCTREPGHVGPHGCPIIWDNSAIRTPHMPPQDLIQAIKMLLRVSTSPKYADEIAAHENAKKVLFKYGSSV